MKKAILFTIALLCAGCISSQYSEDDAAKIASGIPLSIRSLTTGSPNSVGGVDAYVEYANLSSKTIKYINFHVVPYNAVGDRVSGSIRNRSTANLRDTGPVEPQLGGGLLDTNFEGWGVVWYNSTIRCMELVRVRIEYMDGTIRNYTTRSSITPLLHPSVSNSCRV